jgi:hypothetical protein
MKLRFVSNVLNAASISFEIAKNAPSYKMLSNNVRRVKVLKNSLLPRKRPRQKRTSGVKIVCISYVFLLINFIEMWCM